MEKGISEDVVEVVLEHANGMRGKQELFRTLTGAKFGQSRLMRQWEKVSGYRNHIAHGGRNDWTKEQAHEALDVVAHVIFHLLEQHPGTCSLFTEYSLYEESEP